MKKYDVHLCTVVLVKLEGIEAESHQEAIKKAEERFNAERIGDALGLRLPVAGADAVYAEDIFDYLVDEDGDPERERSRWYRPEDLEQGEDRQEVDHGRNVELHVQGGTVTVASRSPDVEVEVRDYDVPETDHHGNPVSDCMVELYEAEPVHPPFCPEDGEPMRKLAEVGGGALAFYDCPSCDGWTYDASQGAYLAGVPSWADGLHKAVADAEAEHRAQATCRRASAMTVPLRCTTRRPH